MFSETTAVLNGVTMTDMKGKDTASSIFFSDIDTEVTLISCTFTGFNVTAIYGSSASSLAVTSSTFSSGTSHEHGTAIFLSNINTFALASTTF